LQALEASREEKSTGGSIRVELTLDEDYDLIIGESAVQALAFCRSLAHDISACLSVDQARVRVTQVQPGSIKATVEIAPASEGQPPAEICALALAAQVCVQFPP